jgi:hypothetical protein
MSSPTFRIFWLRETGCDAGVVRAVGEIEPVIRDRVLELTAGEDGEFTLRLPYLDHYEWKRRSTVLGSMSYEREDRLIRAVLTPWAATRDLAATLTLTDAVWRAAPGEREQGYYDIWHRVSLALQRTLKEAIARVYFADLERLLARDSAYSMVVYQGSRPFSAKARRRFTYDLRDYPECRPTVASATMQIGGRVQRAMEPLRRRLTEAGVTEAARRFNPAWHQDVVNAVRRKPRRMLELLMREAEIVDAVIEMGTDRSHLAVHSCARKINTVLRCVEGVDMRAIGVEVLDAATKALAQAVDGGGQNVVHAGAPENGDAIAARSPDRGIGLEEDGDDGNSDGRGEVADAGVVADVQAGGREPAGQFV